jgi:hydrogenase nickel incorporation protein HypB
MEGIGVCTVCGCEVHAESGSPAASSQHHHDQHDHHQHDHIGHDHHHHHAHDDGLLQSPGLVDAGGGLAGVHVPGLSQQRIVRIERDILAKNDGYARANRARLAQTGTFALNLVSGPGAGKTTLLCRTIADLKDRLSIVVIEGDQQTSNDAERIRATGVPAVQINTGRGCHLDAHMVGHALDDLPVAPGGLLFIENVGNLVCPSGFDLGEAHKVVILSVTEGEDKPLKYPDMFAAADLMLLTKADLLPHLDFDVGACMAAALRTNPRLQILTVSAKTGEGLSAFYAWLETRSAAARAAVSLPA